MEHEMTQATAKALEQDPNVDYVSREEFESLLARIDSFNSRSGHKL
jgi:hypothetical protein